MIAVETSLLVSFFEGGTGKDVDCIEAGFHASAVFLPPPVLTEIMNDLLLTDSTRKIVLQFPLLSIQEGFWEHAGALRARVLSDGKRARLPDALIAQMSIDHGLLLVTRDTDFKAFAKVSNLKLI